MTMFFYHTFSQVAACFQRVLKITRLLIVTALVFAMIPVLLLHSCTTIPQETSDNLRPTEQAQQVLEKWIENGDTPGVQYCYFNRDSVLYSFVGGLKDAEKQKPMQPTTTLHAFSTTKTLTALMILHLHQQGKLSIEDTAFRYLPNYAPAKRFTIRQLLSHTAGMPNPLPLQWTHLQNNHASFRYEDFARSIMQDYTTLDYAPGTKFAYSNPGFLLLGEIIQNASGMSYGEYMRRFILPHLRLSEDAYFDIVLPSPVERHAKGHTKRWSWNQLLFSVMLDAKIMEETHGSWTQFQYFYVNSISYAGLFTNMAGFTKYAQMLLRSNECIADSTKALLFTPQRLANGEETGMCLSWFTGTLGKKPYVAHAGGGGGYYCEIRLYPDRGEGSVVMMNRTGMSDERILDKIDQFFVK